MGEGCYCYYVRWKFWSKS